MSGIFAPSEQNSYGRKEKRLLVEDCLHIPTLPDLSETPKSNITDQSCLYYKNKKICFWDTDSQEFVYLLSESSVEAAGVTGSVQYRNSSGAFAGNDKFNFYPDFNRLVVGGGLIPTGSTIFDRTSMNLIWDGTQANQGSSVYRAIAYNSTPSLGVSFTGFKYRGNINTPSRLLLNDEIASFAGASYNSDINSSTIAGRLTFCASEDWTETNGGSYASLFINQNGTSNLSSAREFRFTQSVFRSNVNNIVDLGAPSQSFRDLYINSILSNSGLILRGNDDLGTTAGFRFRNLSNNNVFVISNTGRTTVGGSSLPSVSTDQLQVIGSAQFGEVAANSFEGIIRVRASQDSFFSLLRTGVRAWQIGIDTSGSFIIRDRDASLDRLTIGTNGNVVLSSTANMTAAFFSTNGLGGVGRTSFPSSATQLVGAFANAGRVMAHDASSVTIGTDSTLSAESSMLTVRSTLQAGSGSLAGNALLVLQTWNTTGSPTAFRMNVTNTTVGANARLMDLQVNNVSAFAIDRFGRIIVPVGVNQPISTGTLIDGTITINNSLVTANSTIILTNINPNLSSKLGTLNVGTITPGVSFVVNSLKHDSPSTIETLDLSTFRYFIIN